MTLIDFTGTAGRLNNTAQLKAPIATSQSTLDGVFAVMDGGRAPDVPEALKTILSGILADELGKEDKERKEGYHITDPLQYLTHTFLTAHRYCYIAGSYSTLVVIPLLQSKTAYIWQILRTTQPLSGETHKSECDIQHWPVDTTY